MSDLFPKKEGPLIEVTLEEDREEAALSVDAARETFDPESSSQTNPASLCEEEEGGSPTKKNTTQVKVRSVLRQVRNQIRSSHVSADAPKTSIMDLVLRVRGGEIETKEANNGAETKGGGGMMPTDERLPELKRNEQGDEEEEGAAQGDQTPVKMQRVFRQVREQIKSAQVNTNTTHNSIMNLVHRIKSRELIMTPTVRDDVENRTAGTWTENGHHAREQGDSGEDLSMGSLTELAAKSDTVLSDTNSVIQRTNSASSGPVPLQNEAQRKMQSIFQQVHKQIKSSHEGMVALENSLGTLQIINNTQEENATANNHEGVLMDEELSQIFEKTVEDCKNSMRDEFKVQFAQLQREMQAYTDQAVRELEHKMAASQPITLSQYAALTRSHGAEQQTDAARRLEKKLQKSPAAPLRKHRVLSRTMTTITPKTCPVFTLGPRSKSETLSGTSKDSGGPSSFLQMHESDFQGIGSSGSKQLQAHGPLPPVYPPMSRRKIVRNTKPQT